MATVNGNKVKYLNNPNLSAVEYYARIVYSVSYPSDTSAKVTWRFELVHGGSLYDSANKAGCNKAGLRSTKTYGSKTYNSYQGQTVQYDSGTKTISRGTSDKTVEQWFWVENLAENSRVIAGGARSTAKASIKINKKPNTVSKPSRPAAPTVSSITQSSFKANMKLPNSNGASITETDFRRYTSSSGGSYVTDGKVTTGTSTTFSGLTADKDYWVTCLAKNSAGWSDESPRTKVTTKDLVAPDAPDHLTISEVTSTSFNIEVPPPATHGSAITAYQIQVSKKTNFSSLVVNKRQGDNDLDVTGRTPGETLYARARVDSAGGYSGWSPTATIVLGSAAPGRPNPPILKYSTETRAVFELPQAPTNGSPLLDQRFQVSSSSGFGTLVHDSSSLGLERQVVGLATGITYYARQAGVSIDGQGPWSENLIFETGFFGSGGPWIGDGGEFKPTLMWIGDGGEWKSVIMSIGDGGEWKPVG